MKFAMIAAVAALLAGSAPAIAASETLPRMSPTARSAALPRQLTSDERANYAAVFAAMRAGAWSDASARLDAMTPGVLHDSARAELYLAKGSPKVDAAPIIALLERSPYLPQAPQLARLAATRGAITLPGLPAARTLVVLPGAPKRGQARAVRDDVLAGQLYEQIRPLIVDDRPSEAEALLSQNDAALGSEAKTELRQRVAWSYYLTGDDSSARRLAAMARGGSGEWTVQADWVVGLAAWRQRDCKEAGDAFASVGAKARDSEMMAAGLFWAARADMACGRPERVQIRLRTAARMPETFYGMLAGQSLGRAIPAPIGTDLVAATWGTLAQHPGIRIAAALSEIGELGLADQALRYQARIGDPREHEALIQVAAKLNLPQTQIWLAQNGQPGARIGIQARYPSPAWVPESGWRVDKSLVFAHALQESLFRPDAVSPAGARGLMQVLPGTAQLIAKRRGVPCDTSRLNEPSMNMDYGQAYLEQLRDFSATGGLLPKVIAAYNAGPGSVQRWNLLNRDRGDPLLYIESIPFAETRGYVAIVLRNYWMYQQQAGEKSQSLRAMAQFMWPRFPGMPGRTALRLDTVGGVQSAD
jgi:soluble lytic murein transglycosylase-like protein